MARMLRAIDACPAAWSRSSRGRDRRRRRTRRRRGHRDRRGRGGLLAGRGQARHPPVGDLALRAARDRPAPGAATFPDGRTIRRARRPVGSGSSTRSLPAAELAAAGDAKVASLLTSGPGGGRSGQAADRAGRGEDSRGGDAVDGPHDRRAARLGGGERRFDGVPREAAPAWARREESRSGGRLGFAAVGGAAPSPDHRVQERFGQAPPGGRESRNAASSANSCLQK